MRAIPRIALIATILLFCAIPASAATYSSLTVPVTVSGIPAGYGILITCNAGQGVSNPGAGAAINFGSVNVPLSSGSFQGNVVVALTKNIAPGTLVKCNLAMTLNGAPIQTMPPGYLSGPNAVTIVTATVNP